MVTYEDFVAVIDAHPELCANGIGVNEQGPNPREFSDLRKELYDCFDGFNKSVRWLSERRRRKTVNEDRTSMQLKHDVGGGIRHGSFIAAALHLGIPMKRKTTDHNCYYLAVSEREVEPS